MPKKPKKAGLAGDAERMGENCTMNTKNKVSFLTGTKQFVPPEYFIRGGAGVSGETRLAMHAAGIGRVQYDATLPAGVLECRMGGRVISRLVET